MNIESLKINLRNVLPILNANLAAAYKEYMDGYISHGAYGHVRSRHETALLVITHNDIQVDAAYTACALLAIDLRTGIKEAVDKAAAETQVENWWQCYRDAGFTEVHPWFNTPIIKAP